MADPPDTHLEGGGGGKRRRQNTRHSADAIAGERELLFPESGLSCRQTEFLIYRPFKRKKLGKLLWKSQEIERSFKQLSIF